MLRRCYHLAPSCRLESHGTRHRLICDRPLQTLTLNEGAWRLLAALQPGVPLDTLVTGLTPDWTDYLEELAARGLLRAEYQLSPQAEPPAVEVVIPVRDQPEGLARCLAGLAAQTYPAGRLRVTVVDDASRVPLGEALPAPPPPGLRVRWLRLERNRGPASARNTGVATPWPDSDGPASPLLAFLDADCVPGPDWLATLAAVLESPEIGAAGGRVRPLDESRLLGRYEGACSSLYLGPTPGAVGAPRFRLAYLPSCNLAVKRDVYARVAGFREGWRFGEDVDLSWRLGDAGLGLFYHPAAVVAHDYRATWGPFLQRKRLYARSEALLRSEHPAHFPPPRTGGVRAGLLLAALAALSGQPLWLLAAALALAGQVLRPLLVRGPLGNRPPGNEPLGNEQLGDLRAPPGSRRGGSRRLLAAALLRGCAGALLLECRSLTRQTLVLWLPGLFWPPLWVLGVLVIGLGAAGEWLARRPALTPHEFLAGYLGEALAYSLGRQEGRLWVAWRALRQRRAAAPAPPPG